jgi:dihydrofolate synthase / folylpolyglutamate synthase
MTYAEAIAYFDTLSQFGIKLDLSRMRRLCELAGHPERDFPSVLVGGTNGKGSTCTMLGAVLQAAGYRVGTAPKPHLYTHRERLQIDGVMIGEAELAALVAEVQPWVAAVAADPALGQPTVFEVVTLLAFLRFARGGVDWAVVEVGLGGRFDATNVLEPALSVITNISLDHTDRLGSTLEAIAFEKAGILRAGRPALTGAAPPGLGVIEAVAASLGTSLWRLGNEIALGSIRVTDRGGVFDLQVPELEMRGLEVGMLGQHQVANGALAAAAAVRLRESGLRVPEAAIRAGLARARIPGRLEVIGTAPLLLLDVGHNPDGARALAAALRDLWQIGPGGRRLWLVLGVSRVHHPAEVVAELAPLATRVFATASTHHTAVPAEETAAMARAHTKDVEVVTPVAEAVAAARAVARPEDAICVTGSFFTVAEAGEPPGPPTGAG